MNQPVFQMQSRWPRFFFGGGTTTVGPKKNRSDSAEPTLHINQILSADFSAVPLGVGVGPFLAVRSSLKKIPDDGNKIFQKTYVILHGLDFIKKFDHHEITIIGNDCLPFV